MTTVREHRINVAHQAILDELDRPTDSFRDLAEAVVNALFPPAPHLDNVNVPEVQR